MVVIMGATGNIGNKLTNILIKNNISVRGVSRSEKKLASLVDQGGEVAAGDVGDVDFLTTAFKGADAFFAMIPPAYGAADFRAYYNRVGSNIVRAIHDSGVRKGVFLSSHGAHLPDKTGPIKGLHDAERKLGELEGVDLVILRPTFFMENLLSNIDMIKNLGFAGGGINGETEFAMIATKDIAQVASGHLLKGPPTGATIHELLGAWDLSMNEVAAIFGKKIGRPDLKYVQFSPEDEKKGLMEYGLSDDASNQLVELNQAISQGLIAVGQPRTAQNTTATTIEEFADLFADLYNRS